MHAFTYTVHENQQTHISLSLFHRDRIERASLTGANREVILTLTQYPFSVTVFQQDIYWTDWNTRAVYRANKNDGSGVLIMATDLQYRPNDIHVFAASKQESCTSPCQLFNGGCSHVCVPGQSETQVYEVIIYIIVFNGH